MTAKNDDTGATETREDDRISVGLLLPHGSRGELTRIHDRAYDVIRRVTLDAERLGFASAWLSDHMISSASPDYPSFESWTILSALAAETKTIRLGVLVTCNSYRHPTVLAKMAATVDRISGGRLEFGIGAGWHKREHAAYGFPYPSLGKRAEMLRESLNLITRLWTEEKVTFEGNYYRTREAVCEPKPVQEPHPPIWVGGKSGGVLSVAAECANACNFLASPTEYRLRLDLLRGYCSERGRDPSQIRTSAYGLVAVGENEAEAKKRLSMYTSLTRTSLAGRIRTALEHPQITFSFLKDQVIARKLPPAWVVGTPEHCARALEEYVNIGVRDFMLHIVGAAEGEALELFAESVMPILTEA